MDSKRLIKLLPIMLLMFSFNAFSHSNHVKTELEQQFVLERDLFATIKTENYAKSIKQIGQMDIDVAGVSIKDKMIDVVINQNELWKLEEAGFNVEVTLTKEIFRAPDSEYQTPVKVEAFIKKYAAKFPNLTQIVEVGKTVQDRTIYGIKISDNAAERELNESTVLFNSMHHAREVMGPEVGIDIISYLLDNYATDVKVKHWVDSNEIYVVPMVNPDGNNLVWTRNNMWRKNARGGYGVDLNRNYPFNWNACNGSSRSRNSQTFRGPKPASEPETQAIMSLVDRIRPVFDISYHSYSELVLYPFGCSDERTGNLKVVEGIGKELGKLLDYKPGTPWELLYNADGGDIDWMYGQFQVIPYVIELSSRKEGFQPSYKKWRDVTVKKNRAGWMHLLDKMDSSALKGRVANLIGSEKNIINVYQLKADGSRKLYQEYKVNADGTYHIVLFPGNFEFELKKGQRSVQSVNLELSNERLDYNFPL
jgi:carboxypeptidase T